MAEHLTLEPPKRVVVKWVIANRTAGSDQTTITYDQLASNWLINHHNNLAVMKELQEHLELKSRNKGRTIGDIMYHMVKNKYDWLQHMTPRLDFQVPDDKLELDLRETHASEWVIKLIETQAQGQRVKGFKSNLFSFVIYLIAHDSHHRGQILQIVKDNQVKLEPSLQYGIWDWK